MAVLGFSEPNCDWLSILTSRKSFSGSSSQTLFFGGDKRQPEIRLRSQARGDGEPKILKGLPLNVTIRNVALDADDGWFPEAHFITETGQLVCNCHSGNK